MNNFSNRFRWFSMEVELHIDLSDLLNDTRILMLTGFNHRVGISMSIVTDDGIDRYDDPFSGPYFPIWECLDYDSCKDFIDQIPVEVLNAVKPFRGDQFGILMLLSQNKFLTNLCEKYSTLFWLFFRQAKNDHWSKQQFISLCESGIWNVLKALNLPANQAALKFLSKITASHCYTQFHVDLIHQTFMQLDYRHLNSKLETAPDHLLQFLLRFPHLQHVKFLGQLERDDYYVFLRLFQATAISTDQARCCQCQSADSNSVSNKRLAECAQDLREARIRRDTLNSAISLRKISGNRARRAYSDSSVEW